MDKKIWLTKTLILHTILHQERKKPLQLSTTQSKCLQPKIYENISVEIILKAKNKAFDDSVLNINWQIYSQTDCRVFHTTCSEFRFIHFHGTNLKMV